MFKDRGRRQDYSMVRTGNVQKKETRLPYGGRKTGFRTKAVRHLVIQRQEDKLLYGVQATYIQREVPAYEGRMSYALGRGKR